MENNTVEKVNPVPKEETRTRYDQEFEGGSKTIDDIIDNLPETTNGKGVAIQLRKRFKFEDREERKRILEISEVFLRLK
ncbi:MAG: hypothetical protein Q4D94_14370 [Bacillota bacterium]|nr:hypothetical protein [Bacillota bacterium]